VQQYFCKNSNNCKNQLEKELLQETCIKRKMSEQTKQLLQKIKIEKMTKERVKNMLHEINTKKMIYERARRKAFARNKH